MQNTESITVQAPIAATVRPVSVLLVYPSTSDVAVANLGFQRVHGLLNQIVGVTCDRFSLPTGWTPESSPLTTAQMRSHDMSRPVHDFDMIAFSISFEPDYLNAVTLLHYFNLPLARKDRGEGHPLIVAGGSALFINPEPMADIVDLCFIGEAEGMIEQFFKKFTETDWDDPREMYESVATVPGVYIPEFYEPVYENDRQVALNACDGIPEKVERHWVEEGSPDLCTHSVIHGEESTFKDMALMEVTRGCIWACRFCTAGFIYRPPREPDIEATYNSLAKVLTEQDKEASTIGLVGPSVTDHPDLVRLVKRLVDEGKTLSFSSLRMETLTDELVDLILKSGQKTLTVAVDAPSERMRNAINKAASDDYIVEKCQFLTEKGVLHLKIYSIIGLPWEEDEDIDRFIELVKRVQQVYVDASRPHGRIGQLTIAVSPLVPKPGTPFQYHPMESTGRLKKKFLKLRQTLGRLPNVHLSFGSPREGYLQTYLTRADRRALSFFEIYLNNGLDAQRALKDASPSADDVVYRQYGPDDFLPWDVIDHGYRDNFLWWDYQRGFKEKHTPVCDTATCKICGIC